MRTLIRYLAEHAGKDLQTIFVVGAGSGGHLSDWRKLDSKSLVLAEAHPELASQLAQRIDAGRHEEVWPKAITAAEEAHATLYLCNNPRYSSLNRPQELTRSFPHLAVTGEQSVAAQSLNQSLQNLDVASDAVNVLVLSAPGQACDLIDAASPEQLQRFEWIVVRADATALYERDDFDACLEKLHAIGFETVQEDTEVIHPKRGALLQRNRHNLEILRLRTQLDALETNNDRLRTQHRYAVEKAKQSAAEHQQQQERLQKQAQELVAERDQQTRLANERKAALDKASADIKQQTETHRKELNALTAERDQQAKLANDRKTALEKAAADLEKQAMDHQVQLTKLTAERDRSSNLVDERNVELDQARQLTALSVRLQTLREADLEELQNRHGMLRERYHEQQQLLKRVSDRLRTASSYFHQLTADESQSTTAKLVTSQRGPQRSKSKSDKV